VAGTFRSGSRRVSTTAASATVPVTAQAPAMPTDCGQRAAAPAAISTPPRPAPSAVPSVSASWSCALAPPCPPAGARPSTVTDSGEYARPMPRPLTAQHATATGTGTASSSDSPTPAMPATRSARPERTKRRLLQAVALRSWTQAPSVQVSVVADTAMPATAALRPFTAVMASGT